MNELETSAEGNVDRIVLEEFFKRAGRGIFIDVGAARPDYLSISALYRAFGWRVIAIEPNPEFCEIHRARGHEVLQYACGDHDEDNVDFTIVDSHGCDYRGGCVSFESVSSLGIKDSYATLKADLDTREIKVNLRRLDTILHTHAEDVRRIDVLSIDVEGWEWRSSTASTSPSTGPACSSLRTISTTKATGSIWQERGYALWRVIEPNDVYVRVNPLSTVAGWLLRRVLRLGVRRAGRVAP